MCWGSGWSNRVNGLPLGMISLGPCVYTPCKCGVYFNSEKLCDGFGNICRSCEIKLPVAVPLPPKSSPYPQPAPLQSKARDQISLIISIDGSVGAFAGLCSVLYCLYLRNKNAHTQNLSLSQLTAATENFSVEHKIGTGSFRVVYKGKLPNGRDLAIKRGEICTKVRKFQEQEIAFDSELALLSRLHHKHLVGLVGFCQEDNERLLVYEYTSNEALHDHLHNKNNFQMESSVLNSWSMRIKIALDAARGIKYLHNYAVPPIVHRDMKSSNILSDANWTARVSDFGLSLILGSDFDQGFMSFRAVGTVGYIDPEYCVLNVLTSKSDVYGFGVVLLELLTGKRAVLKNEGDGTGPIGAVEYAAPQISAGNFRSVIDGRVGLPGMNEVESV